MDTFTIILTNTNYNYSTELDIMNNDYDIIKFNMTIHDIQYYNNNFIKYFMKYTTFTLLFWIHIVIILFWFFVHLYDMYQERRQYINRQ